MARKPGYGELSIPVTLRDRLRDMAKQKKISPEALIEQMLDQLETGVDAESLPKSEEVEKAIALGAKKADLIQMGMEWAAKLFLSQKKSKEESGVVLSELSDVELETLDAGIAKKIGGVTELKLSRMIAKLETWNDQHAGNPDRMIYITPSYLMGLRDEMNRLTNGKIAGLNRNQVFAYFTQAGSAITPRGLSQSHNRKVDAIALGIQAQKDLIKELADPDMQAIIDRHLNA